MIRPGMLRPWILTAAMLLQQCAYAAEEEEQTIGARFDFVKPGQTTRAEAVEQLGKPSIELDDIIVEGEIDITVPNLDMSHIREVYERKGKKPVVNVHVVAWDLAWNWRERARLVYSNEKLLYAILPSPPESTLEKIKGRYGRDPKAGKFTRLVGDVRWTYLTYAYPDEGVVYLAKCSGDGCDRITHKVLFSPKKFQ